MTYDVIVIGSGPGGYEAALRAASHGLKTACIEKGLLGGTCLNVGCIPSKALLHSSERYAKMGHLAEEEGIRVERCSFDFARIMERKGKICKQFNQGIEALFRQAKVDWIRGTATFLNPRTIAVGSTTFEAKQIILATGSEPIELPFLPFDEQKIVSSTGALSLSTVPKKLLIIGAGIIGIELGSVYRRLGSEVTIVEFLDRICPGFDLALAKGLQKSLAAQGISFHLSSKVTGGKITGSSVQIVGEGPSGSFQMEGDVLLVAVGRKPYSKGLGLEKAGVKQNPKGFVEIDDAFRTSQPHIFAIGDLVPGPMLAHKASAEGVVVADAIAGKIAPLEYIAIPSVAYTDPEAAAVGFTEEELKARGVEYRSGQVPFRVNSRAQCTGEIEGFVKVLAEKKRGSLLGVHILGAHASELIAEGVLALQRKVTAAELAETPHAHPTLSEAIKEAALKAVGK